ncbi:MAG: TlpA disulfide reductase family protein [Actinomycetota bacterium]
MASIRPRLLAVSLAIAVVVSAVGALVWANAVGSDRRADAQVDAALTESGVVPFPDTGITNPDMEGDVLPAADLSDEFGAIVPTASLLGDQPLVLNFWFSTCAPCRKELPDFAEVHGEVGDEVRFLGVNPMDTWAVQERFATERGVEYDLLLDDLQELQLGLEILNFPTTLFVTPDGMIVEQAGVLDADGLRMKVDELLESSS